MDVRTPSDPEEQYWFNTRTHTVEKGRASGWADRMGPYATEAEARNALERAKARTEAWDDNDKDWENR